MARTHTRRTAEEREEEVLRQREESALEQLAELGFRISLHEQRHYVDPDPLRGIEGGWRSGTCYAIATSTSGKLKSISGVSAVDALDQARAFLRYQEERLSPELRFVVAKGNAPMPVRQQVGSENARKERGDDARRIVAFDEDGIASVVKSHGRPMGEDNRASQFATSDPKGARTR
jgi:hypothetical protein